MKDPQLFAIDGDVEPRPRHQSSGQRAWVATWGTRLALVCGRDEASVRARVRVQTRLPLTDDQITVRLATKDDEHLANDFDFGDAQQTSMALSDWRYGIKANERERES